MGGTPGGCRLPVPAPVHLREPPDMPGVLVLTQEARTAPPPEGPCRPPRPGPLGPSVPRPLSQMSPPSISQARQDHVPCPAHIRAPGSQLPACGLPRCLVGGPLRPVASPRHASSRRPQPRLPTAQWPRYKPGRPPVLRLPDQVTPAAASALPPARIRPPRRPLHLCFLACVGESGFRQPLRGVLCADCRPCPTCSFLEPQTPDRTPQSRATY